MFEAITSVLSSPAKPTSATSTKPSPSPIRPAEGKQIDTDDVLEIVIEALQGMDLHRNTAKHFQQEGVLNALVEDSMPESQSATEAAEKVLQKVRQKDRISTSMERFQQRTEEMQKENATKRPQRTRVTRCEGCNEFPQFCTCSDSKEEEVSEEEDVQCATPTRTKEKLPRTRRELSVRMDRDIGKEEMVSLAEQRFFQNARTWEEGLQHQHGEFYFRQHLERYCGAWRESDKCFSKVLTVIIADVLKDMWLHDDKIMASQRLIRILEGIKEKCHNGRTKEEMQVMWDSVLILDKSAYFRAMARGMDKAKKSHKDENQKEKEKPKGRPKKQ
jgi:hypothetical protein